MITGPLITENPFGLVDIIWREVGFAVSRTQVQSVNDVTVRLPDALRTAVPKRQSEYLAGRLCAAHALRAMGLPETVGINDRAPVWPQGAVGSISHSDNRAIAVVSRDLAGLGVDVEPLMTAAQAKDVRDIVLTAAETTRGPRHLSPEAFLTLAFSAKESVYKALSPHLSQMPSFHDVNLLGVTSKTVQLHFAGVDLTAHFMLTDQDVTTMVAFDAALQQSLVVR